MLAEAADHLTDDGVLIVEVGNSQVHVQALYPEVDFTGWNSPVVDMAYSCWPHSNAESIRHCSARAWRRADRFYLEGRSARIFYSSPVRPCMADWRISLSICPAWWSA